MPQTNRLMIKTKTVDHMSYGWDRIRKKYVKLTPEEGVRQQLVEYLIVNKGFNLDCFSVEKGFSLNHQRKRYDIVVYKNARAEVLIECKAPNVKIDAEALKQIQTYNYKIKARIIILTNGSKVCCLERDALGKKYKILRDIPTYETI